MTRNLVLAEWLRAYASLQAAENLTRDGLYADAISRSDSPIRLQAGGARRPSAFSPSLSIAKRRNSSSRPRGNS